MALEGIQVGIMFNALVSFIVAGISFALTLFLFQRWQLLDRATRAYAGFWVMTMLVWAFTAARYIYIALGYFVLGEKYYGSLVHVGDIIIQMGVFFTGPPVFYYLGYRVFGKDYTATLLSGVSLLLGIAALWFVLIPGGISLPAFTFFSADSSLGTIPFIIFSVEITIIFLLLVYDIIRQLYRWRRTDNKMFWYYALYSATLLVYVLLGSIDQSKIILDWPLVVFRMFYGGAFLMAYIAMAEYHAYNEEYLVEEKKS